MVGYSLSIILENAHIRATWSQVDDWVVANIIMRGKHDSSAAQRGKKKPSRILGVL
jgi:hypothetical protein